MKETIVLVDAMNLCWRSFFAFPKLSYHGRHTGTYYGFFSQLQRLRQRFSKHVVICWDRRSDEQKTNWRNAIFPGYKGKRKLQPEAAVVFKQVETLYSMAPVLGYRNLYVPGLEADDIIGIMVSQPQPYVIYSGDKDLLQLLDGERVVVAYPNRGKVEMLNQAGVEKKFGFPISRWAHYLALGGDTSDDIHVLPQIGPKRAQALVQAGVSASLAWSKQPKDMRSEHPDWEMLWPKVQAAYNVAHIPRSCQDTRIAAVLRADGPSSCLSSLEGQSTRYSAFLRETAGSYKARLDQFTGFCADHGLSEFMSNRRAYIL